MLTVDKSRYDNAWYSQGASRITVALWFLVNALVIRTSFIPFSKLKVLILRVFGASVGTNVTIKPGVSVKYPWKLKIGDYVGLGENVWIDNLGEVVIGNQVTLSQGAMLLTGNHDYKSSKFDLVVKPIMVEEGAWIGARSIVCPGVTCGSHAVLTVGSIAKKDLEPYGIYAGDPAQKIKTRVITE